MLRKHFLDIAGEPGRFPALDGLRAIAIIFVLCRHAAISWERDYDNWLWTLISNGWLGVDLFFVLSGFLISFHLLNKWPDKQYSSQLFIKSYAIKRCLRILPLYICIIFLVSFKLVPYYEPSTAITADQIRYHILFLQDYFYSEIIVPLWSLGTEEKFYILAPLLIYFVRSKPFIVAASSLFCIVIILGFSQEVGVRNSDPANYSIFFWNFRAPFHFAIIGLLMGSVVALCVHHGLNQASIRRILQPGYFWFVFGVLLLVMTYKNWLSGSDWWQATRIILFSTLTFTFMVLVAATSKDLSSGVLGRKFMRVIARLSYPLYICHMTVIPGALLLEAHLSISNDYIRFLVFTSIYLLLAVAFAIGLHLVVEKPFLIVKSKYR